MIVIKGEYNVAQVMIDEIDSTTREQIQNFVNNPAFGDKKKIRIMPDCHAGAGSCIGFTMELGNYIMPQIVGVDIGCGMLAIDMGTIDIPLEKLDDFIKNNIPSGREIHDQPVDTMNEIWITELAHSVGTNASRVMRSIGTLGGGNHFIEVAVDKGSHKWLIIHSGSRNLGKTVAEYYQNKAKEDLAKRFITVGKDMEFLLGESQDARDYLDAMKQCQEYATLNRKHIANPILKFLSSEPKLSITSVHNYIDFDMGIIRKGAISANTDELCIIPFNSAEGSAICVGKGNKDWNYSAPHGAGRLYSRSKAKELFDYKEYQKALADNGVYSTTANTSTIDEAPMAYKSKDTILSYINETVQVIDFLKPIYNFKASEGGRRK